MGLTNLTNMNERTYSTWYAEMAIPTNQGGGSVLVNLVFSVGLGCKKENTTAITKPTATMARCAGGPARPVLDMALLLLTLRALCAVQDNSAAAKPVRSKVGEFHEAAAIPRAIGTREANVKRLGIAFVPSNRSVRSTVIKGIPHLVV